MSLLDKHRKNNVAGKKNKYIGTRVTDEVYEKFNTRLQEVGLSVTEAITIFIEDEIKNISDDVIQKNNKQITVDEYLDIKGKTNDNEKENKNRTKKTTNGKRFDIAPYRVDNQLPCPLCNEWKSASNFSRHSKQHDTVTAELFESNMDKVIAMVAERKKLSQES